VVQKIYDSRTTAGSSEAATRAILNDKVDVLMAQGTPDTTNRPTSESLCGPLGIEPDADRGPVARSGRQ
jgi:hypothetical protein